MSTSDFERRTVILEFENPYGGLMVTTLVGSRTDGSTTLLIAAALFACEINGRRDAQTAIAVIIRKGLRIAKTI
jgi:hypothetical protein